MTKYLAGVLTVIAAGVLLIAYGLLGPRASALGYADQNPYAVQSAYGMQPAYGSGAQPGYSNGTVMTYPYGNSYLANNGVVATPVNMVQAVPAVQTVQSAPVRRQTVVRTVDRTPRRDWKRTALIVGGSSATGAGIGGIVGGKKGALIGAALGGGISTIYETTKDR
jgi:hypothetical protein